MITEKWIVIRGHSFAGTFIEQYQIATKQSTKQKALRKTLKQSDAAESVLGIVMHSNQYCIMPVVVNLTRLL